LKKLLNLRERHLFPFRSLSFPLQIAAKAIVVGNSMLFGKSYEGPKSFFFSSRRSFVF